MELDVLLRHYFGTDDPATLDTAAFEHGVEKLGTAFGTETEPGRRFALWSLRHALGDAPDPALAFEDAALRRAAEEYARAADRLGGG